MQSPRARPSAPVADWPTKRDWVDYAFAELEKAGYTIASAYTAVKDPAHQFLYRDLLWTGADMIGLGVASFSHVNGTHYQNEHDWDPYIDRVHDGELPIYRALTPTDEERMIREFILQMKLGHVHRDYFQRKFGVDVRQRFAAPLDHLQERRLSAHGREQSAAEPRRAAPGGPAAARVLPAATSRLRVMRERPRNISDFGDNELWIQTTTPS